MMTSSEISHPLYIYVNHLHCDKIYTGSEETASELMIKCMQPRPRMNASPCARAKAVCPCRVPRFPPRNFYSTEFIPAPLINCILKKPHDVSSSGTASSGRHTRREHVQAIPFSSRQRRDARVQKPSATSHPIGCGAPQPGIFFQNTLYCSFII